MKICFTKMQGTGNDFIMLDGIRQRLDLSPAAIRLLADRRLGIGADQVLVVEAAPDLDTDFRYRIFNADGSEVEQCGNGARCFVKFVHQLGLTRRDAIRVITAAGRIEPRLEADGMVSVDLGPPNFHPGACGFDTTGLLAATIGAARAWTLDLDGQAAHVVAVSMGNPHAVQLVDNVDHIAVAQLGSRLEHEPRFAQGVNAGFLQILDRRSVRLRVWERGVGETPACGTGACAAAVTGMRMGLLDSTVTVHVRGGDLRVQWHDMHDKQDRHDRSLGREEHAACDALAPAGGRNWGRRAGDATHVAPVRLSGPAERVFDGEIDLP